MQCHHVRVANFVCGLTGKELKAQAWQGALLLDVGCTVLGACGDNN
jgi:hypothetical protein